MRPFLEFEYDQFSSIVVSDQFSRFLVNVFFNHHRMPPSCSAERDHGSSRFHYPRRELVLKSCLGSHAGVINYPMIFSYKVGVAEFVCDNEKV